MKSFKKLFCALFSLVLMLSVVLPCFAEEASLEEKLEVAFTSYCNGKVPMHIDDVKEVNIKDIYTVDDIVVFSADSWKWQDHGKVDKTFEGWDITASFHHFPYDLGVYVYKDGRINTLDEALEAKALTNLGFLNDFEGIRCIHQDFTKLCAEAFLKYKGETTSDEVGIECLPLGSTNEYTFFQATINRKGYAYPTIVVDDMIGNYIYRASRPYGPENNPTGRYALAKDGTVCPAFELYEAGILTDEEIAKAAGGVYSTELDKYGEWDYEETIIPALKEKYEYLKNRHFLYSELYAHYSDDKATPEYVLIHVFPQRSEEQHQTAHIINDLVFEQKYSGIPFTYGYGIYIFETGEFYDFTEVPDLSLEGKSNLYKSVNYRYRMGDNNRDYNLTIQDATYMQKCLANLEQFRSDDDITEDFHNPQKKVYISDYNRDGVRNVKDVTAIQKRIAGIDI